MRVNVEDRFFSETRFWKLSQMLGSEALAVGYCVLLWHGSQGEEAEFGSWDDIRIWLRITNRDDAAKVISALCVCGFLFKKELRFVISGNEKQIGDAKKHLAKLKKMQKAGGKATKEKWRGEKNQPCKEPESSGNSEGLQALLTSPAYKPSEEEASKQGSIQYNSIQFNSTQGNSIQLNSIQSTKEIKLSKAPDKSGAQTREAIAHYCSEYNQRYGINPMIGKKEAGIIKRLLSECSQDRLAVLISAYVKMPDAWFITRGHDLPTFATNLNKVTLFAEKGRMLTSEDARTIEAQAHHSAVVADVIKMRELERAEERNQSEN